MAQCQVFGVTTFGFPTFEGFKITSVRPGSATYYPKPVRVSSKFATAYIKVGRISVKIVTVTKSDID